MKNQTQIDFDGARMVFDAEPVSTTPSCSMTIDDIQIFLDRMPASVWRAYLAADAVDLATTLSGMLSISDAFGHIKSFADLARLAIWMECEGFADDEMMEAS